MSKVAFASIDGTEVDQHFGSARYFQIYEINKETQDSKFIETRKTTPSCKGNCDGGFKDVYEILKDCNLVFVSKIGEGAAGFMISKNIRVFEASGAVEDIILEVLNNDII
jgi:predicted Fe-Mo cluster-binding NifX family protein